MPKESPLFSVIVPTCNRPRDLSICLGRLVSGFQTLDHSLYEVIVSDDSSGIELERIVKENFPWVVFLQGPRRGPASNRNHAATAARGEWLVFVDDDCLPEPGLLEAYSRAIAEFPTVIVFEGKTVPLGNRQRLDEHCPDNQTGGKLWSCNFAIKAKNFKTIGGFDDNFPYAAFEDIEFCIRLNKSRVKIAFCENAVVFHPWRKDKGFKFWFYAIDSLVFLIKKHPDQKKYFSLTMNIKIFIGTFYKYFFSQFIVLNGRGGGIELLTMLWIFLVKIYKINFLAKLNKS